MKIEIDNNRETLYKSKSQTTLDLPHNKIMTGSENLKFMRIEPEAPKVREKHRKVIATEQALDDWLAQMYGYKLE